MGKAAARCLPFLALAWAFAALAEEALYRLPYADGEAHMISQAPGGMISTHTLHSNRHAVDFAMPEGTPVVAARAGRVVETEWRHGGGTVDDPFTDHGNLVVVEHADGTRATYAHLRYAGVRVAAGEEVAAGQVIGYSGTTGFSSGPHLHFGVSRLERAGERWEEVSIPVTFYVGRPAVAFAPRAALTATANYSSPAEAPRTALEAPRLPAWHAPELGPEEEAVAWEKLALWVASAALGLAWFWRFSHS